MRNFWILLLAFALGCAPDAKVIDSPIVEQLTQGQRNGTGHFDHSAWTEILKGASKPESGRVDYTWVKANQIKLDAYLKSLADADLSLLGRNEQFALLLNAYNAFTIKLIIENYPSVKSIRDLSKPWNTSRYVVAGVTLSLDDIEHGLLRPLFKDPRIHFGVNCASIGCPPLSNDAFEGKSVESQLDKVAKATLTNSRYAGVKDGRLQLNAILDWYGADFTDETFIGHAKTLPVWVARYSNEEVKALVKKAGGSPEVVFMDYDWQLNDSSR
jgi:hypothetical protein